MAPMGTMTGQAEHSETLVAPSGDSVLAATASGGSVADAAISEEVCTAQTHKMTTTITENAINKGMTSWTRCTGSAKLENAELGMPATSTDISGRSAKGTALVSSGAMFMIAGNTDVGFMTAKETDVASAKAGDFVAVAML